MLTRDSETETSARRLVYLAAERTLFAWVRTALALMALGFVVDRFGLFVRQLVAGSDAQFHPKPFSFWAGTSLVILGVLMTVVAGVRYSSFALRYQREGSTEPGYGLSLGILFTVLTAIAGIAITLLLVTVTD
jgi:putative membrane protein